MTNVKVMWDGLNAWKTDGHPIDPPGAADKGKGITAPVAGVTIDAPSIATVPPAPKP